MRHAVSKESSDIALMRLVDLLEVAGVMSGEDAKF